MSSGLRVKFRRSKGPRSREGPAFTSSRTSWSWIRLPGGASPCLHRPLTLPAGANSQLHVNLRGVDGPVVGDQVGVVGHPIHVERHHGKLHVDDVVVPLLIADLKETKSLDMVSRSCSHTCRVIPGSDRRSIVLPLFPVGFPLLFRPWQPLARPHLPL